jgi:hypothetical protein
MFCCCGRLDGETEGIGTHWEMARFTKKCVDGMWIEMEDFVHAGTENMGGGLHFLGAKRCATRRLKEGVSLVLNSLLLQTARNNRILQC